MMSLSSFTFYVVYYPLHHRILLRLFPGTPEYLPILYVDRLKIMNKHLEVSLPLSVVWERERRSRKSVISLSPSPLPLLPLTPLTPPPPPPPSPQRVWPGNSSLPLRISYSPVSLGQLRMWLSFHNSLKALRALGQPLPAAYVSSICLYI